MREFAEKENLFIGSLRYGPLNIENSHLSYIFMSTLFRQFHFLTELWHLLNVSAVVGHGAVFLFPK